MGLRLIMYRTLTDLMSLKRTLALVFLGVAPAIIAARAWQVMLLNRPMSLVMQTHYVVDYFIIILFMWVTGFFLALTVAASAASFISKEDTDGTLLLLVSKPINRYEIVLGKFLALVINTMMLVATVLLLSILVFWFVLPIDIDTFKALLWLLPWMLLYSLLVTLAFGSISIALSALMKSRVKIMVVVMLIILLPFFVGMMPRTIFSEVYEDYHLYYPDLGYHLGNTFVLLLDQTEGGKIMPSNQRVLGLLSGTFEFFFEPRPQDWDPDLGSISYPADLTNYISPAASLGILLGMSLASLGLAIVAMERKQL